MSVMAKGVIAAVIASFLFGFTPIIGKLSYDGGSNAVMLTLLRSLLAIPILFLIMKAGKIPFTISAQNKKEIVIMSIFGAGATTLTVYQSYNYISVGMATLIHFTYPSFVALYSVVFLKEKMTRNISLSLLFSIIGLALFCDDLSGSDQLLGFALALISAVTFAFVMIYQYRSSLIFFHPFKMSFYQCSVVSVAMLLFGFSTGDLTLSLTPQAWFYSFIVAACVSVAGLSLVQYGLQYIASTASSVLSLLEPITSVVTGIIVLGESFTMYKFLGCVLIIGGVILFTFSMETKEEPVAVKY